MIARPTLLALTLVLVACAPLYTRTKPMGPTSAFVTGKLDDAAQSELNRRAKESCGGADTYEFFCNEPVPDEEGVRVYWTCDHPQVQPTCPPTAP